MKSFFKIITVFFISTQIVVGASNELLCSTSVISLIGKARGINNKLNKISPDLNLNSITHDRDVLDFLKTLSERDRTILEMRFDDPSISQSKVAYAIGLSRQRIFQIENQLLEKLRQYLKRQGRAIGNGIKPAPTSTEKMNEKLSKISPDLNLNSITNDRDVQDYLKILPERYRNILEMRFDDPPRPQREVGHATGLSQEQISRIENQLLEGLRRYLKRQGRTVGNGIKPDISLLQSLNSTNKCITYCVKAG